jgi:Tfp pilus assembly protein PilF
MKIFVSLIVILGLCGCEKKTPNINTVITNALKKNVESGMYLKKGMEKSHKGDRAGAILDYTKAIELNPENKDAYALRGLEKLSNFDSDEGCLDLRKASELGDTKADELIRKFCD